MTRACGPARPQAGVRLRSREDVGVSSKWVRFYTAVAALALAGIATAMAADSPLFGKDTPYVDAVREVGGALVAGAVVAMAVVWFEERREDDRIEREERRDDAAAMRAWQREVDVRLITIMRSEISTGRPRRVRQAEREHRMRVNGAQSPPILRAALGGYDVPGRRPFWDAADEAEALISFLRDDALTRSFQEWAGLLARLEEVSEESAYTDDMFKVAVDLEHDSWKKLSLAVEDYVKARYPKD